jgi:hypothetical protein
MPNHSGGALYSLPRTQRLGPLDEGKGNLSRYASRKSAKKQECEAMESGKQ